jgi:hypothetical protein
MPMQPKNGRGLKYGTFDVLVDLGWFLAQTFQLVTSNTLGRF